MKENLTHRFKEQHSRNEGIENLVGLQPEKTICGQQAEAGLAEILTSTFYTLGNTPGFALAV